MPDSIKPANRVEKNVRTHQNIIEQNISLMNYAIYAKQSQSQFGDQIRASSVPVWIDGGGVRRVPCCGRRVAAAGGQRRGGVGRVQRGDDRGRRGRWSRRGGTLGRRADGVRPEES